MLSSTSKDIVASGACCSNALKKGLIVNRGPAEGGVPVGFPIIIVKVDVAKIGNH